MKGTLRRSKRRPSPPPYLGTPPQRRRRFRRRSAAALLTVLLVAVGAEAGARALSRRLPDPLRWHSWEAQVKYDAVRKLGRSGGVDIAALGDSMMNVAFDPPVSGEAMGGGCSAYNASMAGANPRIVELWARRTVLPRLRPSVVVIGLQTFDLNENAPNVTRFLRNVRSSPAARREWGGRTTLDELDAAIARRSALYRERTVIRDPDVLVRAMRGRVRPELGEARFITEWGYQGKRRAGSFVDSPRYEARIAGLLRRFETGGRQSEALVRLVGAVRDAGARAVVVAMPVHPRYAELHPGGRPSYERAKASMAALVGRAGARWVDLDRLTEARYFADLNHVNAAGSAWFSQALGEQLRGLSIARDTHAPGTRRCSAPIRAFG